MARMVDSGAQTDLSLADGKLSVSGNCILSDVHGSIFLTPSETSQGSFIGVKADHQRGSRLGIKNFMSLSVQVVVDDPEYGDMWQDIPCETQFLMVEVPDSSQFGEETEDGEGRSKPVYCTVFLPILEGDFRAVLQGNPHDDLEICLESGLDPYSVIAKSIKCAFRYVENDSAVVFLPNRRQKIIKQMPDMLDWFGWCTWDAFYTDVTAEGVKEGINSLEKGGASPKFVIIDDGWQSVAMDPTSSEAKCEDSAK
ncbi:UNVERIFIED_CONTAM: putative galactinol--sucrose galactosyltransferase 1 [Sesamum latifolium]|uniref:galactinol--sucrose galactosyltransferase n=1 Tax=Sesamum latifolium TaxID=2727402 RepID=A0AAW2WMT1_9LAMI